MTRDQKKISIAWSGGKDSMLALDRIIRSGEYKVDHLHTVIDADLRRVGLHGVHEKLIDAQAASLGLPLEKLYLKASPGHNNYEQLMESYFANLENEDFEGVMYGDIFLEDLKSYREKMLHKSGLEGVYPLWNASTDEVMSEFLKLGYKTKLCAADAKHFNQTDVGQTIDEAFVKNLPGDVDVCGENGEFHTFVYDGPLFHFPIELSVNEVVSKSYEYNKKNDDGSIELVSSKFWFADLVIDN